VTVTPDGRRAVSASWDKTLRVWDLATGSCEHVLRDRTGVVSWVGTTIDGRHAISCGWDKALRLWDIDAGVCMAVAYLPLSGLIVVLSSLPSRIIASNEGSEILQFDLQGVFLTNDQQIHDSRSKGWNAPNEK
jgi:WD40 repeat protein